MDPDVRRRGLGGTDSAAIMGLSPWRDPVDVWMEKIGHPMWRPKPETPAMRWGKILEPVIRVQYTIDTGIDVVPWLPRLSFDEPEVAIWAPDGIHFGHPDGAARVQSGLDTGIWEGKTSSTPADWEQGVPVYYLVQVQQYMDITESAWADVTVLLPGGDFRTYRIEADPIWQYEIASFGQSWWQQYVDGKTPPAPVPHEIRVPIADKEKTIKGTPEAGAVIADILSIQEKIAALEAQEAELKAWLKEQMGDAGHMAFDGTKLRVDYTHSAGPKSVGWEQVATSLWNSLEMVRRYTGKMELPEDVTRYLDPGLYDTLIGLYSTVGKATRPLVIRQPKKGAGA